MSVLLAKERVLKLIQVWDEKQIKSQSLPELLLQLSNDSRTIDEMLKQRVKQHKQYQPEEIQELMCKLLEDVRNINEELSEFTNSPSWDHHMIVDDKEHLFNLGSDELIKSSVENLVPIPSYDNEPLSNEDVPMENFKIYLNPLFDDEEIISNKIDPHYFNAESNLIESLPNRDTLFDSSPKFVYLKEFSGELMPTSIINEERIKREHEEYISLMEKLLTINSFPRSLENFHANTIIEALPTSPIPIVDNDSLREEIDIFTDTNDLMPPGIESDDYDSEGDIHFLEELLSNDSIPLFENESSNFDHHDDPSFSRPPLKPPMLRFSLSPIRVS
nr:hypothetical protein [Tanacetum cinerariifolium]